MSAPPLHSSPHQGYPSLYLRQVSPHLLVVPLPLSSPLWTVGILVDMMDVLYRRTPSLQVDTLPH